MECFSRFANSRVRQVLRGTRVFRMLRTPIATLLVLAMAFVISPAPLFAATATKTVTSFVYSSPSAVSSLVNIPVTLYIGDDISLVVSPMKSVYYTATGVYTGGGTVAFSVDGLGISTFTLPNVGSTPTVFTLIYKDSGIMSPTTAGSFNYTLSVTPSGVTLYGLGVELTATYEYTLTSCPDGQQTNEKNKTQETYVYASPSQVATAINAPVTLYIGDDISGVTNPIKSAYFVISGIYTGGGTYAFTINSDAGTAQSFTLPNVGSTPTRFSIKYKDTEDIISPTTAGTYNYVLNMVPTGITVSGLGAVLITTYRHKPAACGGYPATGDLYSTTFDTTGSADGPAYNSIVWKGVLGGPSETIGRVRFQLATSDNAGGPWSYIGGSTCNASDWFEPTGPDEAIETNCPAQFNNKRYFRYRLQICSLDCTAAGTYTPTVNDVAISWSP